MPIELQTARSECGLACLAMVVGCFDNHADLATMRRRFVGHSHGLTLKDIAGFAESLGLISRGLRAEPKDLAQLRKPAILHWNMDHFVVLVAAKRRGCIVHDPAVGRQFCTWKEVGDQFTGVALELWPADGFQRSTPAKPGFTFSDLWGMSAGSRRQIAWVLLLSMVLQIMVLVGPWHVQWTVDEALLSGDTHLIGVLCLGFGMLLVCRIFTHVLRGLLVVYLGHSLSFYFACRLLQHLVQLPLTWFEQRHVGDIVSRFGSLQPVRDLLTQGAAAGVVDLFMVMLSLLLMFVYSPLLAALVLVVHVAFMLFEFCFVPRLKQHSMGVVVAQAAEQSHMLETTRAIHNVKVYGQERVRLDQWQQLHARTLDASLSLQRTQLGLGSSALFVGGVELIVIIYLAAHQVLDGAFTLGMLFAFLSYRGHFTERLRGLVGQIVNLRTMRVHLQRLGEIWGETPEPSRSSFAGLIGSDNLLGADSTPKPLWLRGVCFRHNATSPWLLQDVELRISSGEFIAIIGPSGGGKTTLLKLLMGLVPPVEGHINWGEVPLHGEVCFALRKQSGCVLQADGFFSGSIAENVTLFERPDMKHLIHCLEQVGMREALMAMPMRENTQIGEIGTGLSSGQLQRLLLARALYRNPNYLFLDEGTANLDVHSATLIHALIKGLACTRVVVTHDLGFAAQADRVFVVESGQLKQANLAAKTATDLSAE